MPFDTAEIVLSSDFAAPAAIEDEAPTAEEALANPDAALAFLFLAPRPCAALDALLAA
jgi:hypothetical protein